MTERAEGRGPRVAWLAWSMVAITYALLGVLAWVSHLNHQTWASFLSKQAFTLVFGTVFSVTGALIASRHPANPVGWLMVTAALFSVLGPTAHAYAIQALVVSPGSLPAGPFASWVDAWAWVPLAAVGPLLFVLIPDGRPPTPGWRWVLYVSVAAYAIMLVGFMATWPFRGTPLLAGPDKLPNPPLLTYIAVRSLPLFFVAFLSSVASIIVRFVRSKGEERQQLKWIAYAAAFVFVEYVVSNFRELPPLVDALAIVPLAAALAIAILKYRLYEIDVVLNKTLVYGSMAVFITAVYVAVVVGIGHAVGSQRNLALSILATALVAVGFQPVRERIQRFANRVVYGNRASPYEVLSEFSGGMSSAVAVEELLPRMARIVADGTGAAEVDVWLNVGSQLVPEASWPLRDGADPSMRAIARDGSVVVDGADAAVPVRHQGELLGAIAVTKPPGDALKPAEAKLLDDLASQAGLVLRNVRLIEELRTSRQRLVTAQDEERRRLERDLHDGAQQRIVSIALAIRMARNLVRPEQADVGTRLDQASEQIQLALSELREFARGVHPAILTERGLVPALESLTERSAIPATVGSALDGRLPGPVEATAYFVVSEALANAAKHSRASSIAIRALASDGALVVEVADDGVGGAEAGRGSGLRGLADRVAAVDGTIDIHSPPGQGTRLTARIPIPALVGVPS